MPSTWIVARSGLTRAGCPQPNLPHRRGTIRHAEDGTWDRAMECERKGCLLDLDRLAFLHKPGVLVFPLGLDFDRMVLQDDDHQRVRRRHDPAQRMEHKLLHHAVDQGDETLRVCALSCLDNFLGKRGRFGLGHGVGLLELGHLGPVVLLRLGKSRAILDSFFC